MTFKVLIDEQMAAYHQGDYADHGSAQDMLMRFAQAVAAVEREACAKVCEAKHAELATRSYPPPKILKEMATTIRKRSNVKLRG